MNIFVDAINWVIANPLQSLAILGAVHMAASGIANITPTQADNKAIEAIYKTVHTLALNFFKLKGISVPDEPTDTKKEG